MRLREIKQRLEDAYCNNIGVEFMHLASDDERDWLKKKFETQHDLCTQAEQRLTLERLVRFNFFQVHLWHSVLT